MIEKYSFFYLGIFYHIRLAEYIGTPTNYYHTINMHSFLLQYSYNIIIWNNLILTYHYL